MEAPRWKPWGLVLGWLASLGASAQTRNFIVHTADPHHAVAFAQQAEKLRRELALAWLGQVLPDWSYPCPITATVGPHLGAGGATSFVFDRGEVYGWRMTIQGSYQRIMDSVLPHEITHMIFASHFRRPLPRWADEGGATTMEHESEKAKHRHMLLQFLRSHRGIPFDRMFAMTEYPADIMPLYAQAYALAEYLIQQGGRRKYVEFIGEGMATGRWTEALRKHYGIPDLGTLQNQWVAWVAQGFPPRKPAPEGMLASASVGSPSSFPRRNPSPHRVSSGALDGSGQPARQQVSGSPALAGRNAQNTAGSSGQPSGPTLVAITHSAGNGSSASATEWRPGSSKPTEYRPGSTSRPGIIWTLPLVALQESGESAPIANSSAEPKIKPASPGSLPGRSQLLPTRLATASPNLPPGTSAQADKDLEPTRRGSKELGRPLPGGPDGWFPAGCRPQFAPGSIAKALANSKAPWPIGSPNAVNNQLTRPQMPESASGILMSWPNTIVR